MEDLAAGVIATGRPRTCSRRSLQVLSYLWEASKPWLSAMLTFCCLNHTVWHSSPGSPLASCCANSVCGPFADFVYFLLRSPGSSPYHTLLCHLCQGFVNRPMCMPAVGFWQQALHTCTSIAGQHFSKRQSCPLSPLHNQGGLSSQL